ncbi:hypothetical protein Efla_005622 [Eimeria flavescens]
MTRLSLCAVALALAAGHCLAEPSTIERAMHRFGDVEILQDDTNDETTTTTTTTTTTAATTSSSSSGSSSTKSFPETAEEFFEAFVKALQKQLQLQEQLMKQLLQDLQDYLLQLSRTFTLDETQSGAFHRVSEMMEMITSRMATARENVDELMATSDTLGNDTLRSATTKFMKEVRVQDVVVDALWASLRGVQTSAFVSGTTGVEDRDAYVIANRAAEEFLARMYHNLRSAGISEEDIGKFVPRNAELEGERGRNMGRKGRYGGYGYGGYGYGGYGYGGYGWGGYGYGYPRYYGYSYGYGHPYYSYGYGYPMAYSYYYPSYYGSYYFRRLRPTGTTPPVPPQAAPPPMMPPPQMALGRALGEELTGMGYSPMLDAAMADGPTSMYEQAMGYPMDAMNALPPMDAAAAFTAPFELGTNTGMRNLAPIPEMPAFAPELPMRAGAFGFGPNTGMPF